MAIIEKLAVLLTADTSRFEKGMRRGSRANNKFRKDVKKTKSALKKLGGALGVVAAVKGFTSFINNSNRAADSAAKVASKLGTTTEALSRLRHAAELTGNSTQQLDIGIQRMTRRIAEAAQGTGEAKAAIKELGLDAKALAKLPVDRQFAAIGDALDKVTSQSDRVRLGFKLFDSEGVGLINTLKGGSAALDRFGQQADSVGLTISGSFAKSAEETNDAITVFKASITGLGNALATLLNPVIKTAAVFMTGTAVAVSGILRVIDKAIEGWKRLGRAVADYINDAPMVNQFNKDLRAELSGSAEAAKKNKEAIDKLITSIKEEAEVAGKTANEIKLYKLEKAGASQATLDFARQQLRLIDALNNVQKKQTTLYTFIDGKFVPIDEKRRDAINAVLRSLREEAQTAGKTRAEIALLTLQRNKAREGTIEYAKAQIKLIEAAEKEQKAVEKLKETQEELKNQAAQVIDSTRTPFERLSKRFEEVKKLFAKGLIDKDTFGRVKAQIEARLTLLGLSDFPDDPKKKKPESDPFRRAAAIERRTAGRVGRSRTDTTQTMIARNTKEMKEIQKKQLEVLKTKLEKIAQGRTGLQTIDLDSAALR